MLTALPQQVLAARSLPLHTPLRDFLAPGAHVTLTNLHGVPHGACLRDAPLLQHPDIPQLRFKATAGLNDYYGQPPRTWRGPG